MAYKNKKIVSDDIYVIHDQTVRPSPAKTLFDGLISRVTQESRNIFLNFIVLNEKSYNSNQYHSRFDLQNSFMWHRNDFIKQIDRFSLGFL